MQHLIKKQVINLQLNKETDAFRVQQTVSTCYRQHLLPLLENIFNEMSSADEVIHIDHLEIDLGMVSEEEMIKGDWGNTVLLKIKEQLYRQVKKNREVKADKQETVAFNSCRQWLFYMQKGYLSWNTMQVNDVWYEQVLGTLAVDFESIAALRRLIRQQYAVIRRIAGQHKEKFLLQLLTVLTAGNQQELAERINEMQRQFIAKTKPVPTPVQVKEYREKLWERLIFLAAGSKKELHAELLIKEMEKPRDADILPAPEPTGEEKIDNDGLFVYDAGMVLIHPFLSALFNRLQWLSQGKFNDEHCRQKALYVLHYAATGREEAEEYELVVPKILCNWPLAMPVQKDMELKKEELLEADNMLRAVIDQWKVLQNTSPDGLREGFLQRKGKYFKRNDKRYLQIESTSIDVLLDQLPWNLGIIKLPWMKDMLWVEWR
ncbi:contractile injection system tape measure protein [Agriterribacter sp.]|uniref:contractile injection system tape measure protein n=1 Tax=Agriterribacter sp. TaxID=2821509 RepID=UPI002C717E8C|nr:contractile injection system tape measure protein [Agriterribacter sp.]HTN06765.1 contractile injection system tape measure protein [Agriterribacter sp.]